MKYQLENFLMQKKMEWIGKKTKSKKAKQDKLSTLQQEVDKRYNVNTWFAKAVKQARPFVTSHPSTFTHSDAKATALYFSGECKDDGLLKTGNVKFQQAFDVYGNAATDNVVWDTYLFLNELVDEKKIIDHFREETVISKAFISDFNLDYDDVRTQFVKMFELPKKLSSSRLLKQVYFPISSMPECSNHSDNYHLLSLVSSSLVMAEMKKRIDDSKFSENAKVSREKYKKEEYCDQGFDDFLNLTVMGFGGTKPQNVSALSIKNNGKFYLLMSAPPVLKKRKIRLPTSNFFKNSLWIKDFSEYFQALHLLMSQHWINNIDARNKIRNTLNTIIDRVLEIAFLLRESEAPYWSDAAHYQNLPMAQKIWLDNAYQKIREDDDDWIEEIEESFSRWILFAYEICLKKRAIMLGDGELNYIAECVADQMKKARSF